MVRLSGLSFVSVDNVKCTFGFQESDARVLDSETIECVSPVSDVNVVSSAAVAMGLSFDGFLVVSDDVQFTYMVPPEIATIVPDVGSTQGNTSVAVTGSGFSLSSELECVFGSDAVPAV